MRAIGQLVALFVFVVGVLIPATGNALASPTAPSVDEIAETRVDVHAGSTELANAFCARDSPLAAEGGVRGVNPSELRFSQTSAGGGGRAGKLRTSMSENGWKGDSIDVVETPDGLVTIDNTRAAVAQELGMTEIPVRVHAPGERLPQGMIDTERFGTSTTWGEALGHRTTRQRNPRIGPTGTPTRPRMPR